MRLIIHLGTALAILTSVAAEAADSQSRFQPYGLGRAPCKRFTEICEAKQEDCKQTGPWIDGYVTAYNSLDKGTFDMFAWQTPELFAQMVFNVCKQHPEAAVVQVVNELMRVAIAPDKVSTAGERVKIGAIGTLEEILLGPSHTPDGTMNLVGALRRAMATTGYTEVKEFQRVEVVVHS